MLHIGSKFMQIHDPGGNAANPTNQSADNLERLASANSHSNQIGTQSIDGELIQHGESDKPTMNFTRDEVIKQIPQYKPTIEETVLRHRMWLAFAFTFLFGLTIVLAVILACEVDWLAAKEFLEILVPTEAALISAATAFYFATKR